MRAINADKLCVDLMERWDIADKQKEELVKQVMADIVTPIVVSQPPVEPERKKEKWIPCSERLPEYGQPVLTWDGTCYAVEKRILVIRDEDGEPIEGDWWVSDDYDEFESDYYPNLRDGACIAWMSLPEPYQGGERG